MRIESITTLANSKVLQEMQASLDLFRQTFNVQGPSQIVDDLEKIDAIHRAHDSDMWHVSAWSLLEMWRHEPYIERKKIVHICWLCARRIYAWLTGAALTLRTCARTRIPSYELQELLIKKIWKGLRFGIPRTIKTTTGLISELRGMVTWPLTVSGALSVGAIGTDPIDSNFSQCVVAQWREWIENSVLEGLDAMKMGLYDLTLFKKRAGNAKDNPGPQGASELFNLWYIESVRMILYYNALRELCEMLAKVPLFPLDAIPFAGDTGRRSIAFANLLHNQGEFCVYSFTPESVPDGCYTYDDALISWLMEGK